MALSTSNVRLRVCGLVVSRGKILLVRHRNSDYFMLPGGAIEPRENFSSTLGRELREEISCKVEKMEYFGTYVSPLPSEVANIPNCSVTFLAEVAGEPKPAAEIAEVKWFTAADLREAKLSQSAKFFAKKLIEKGMVK